MEIVPQAENSLVLSYLELRKSVGVIGISLPFVLAIGYMILQGPGILGSISSYYYSTMGNVFVGALCANGVFLWSYRGYERQDMIAGHIAAISAFGIALFPTTPDVAPTQLQTTIGMVHLIFAFIFFLTLAYFALVLFRKTAPGIPPTRMKLVRNQVYLVTGILILTCIAMLVVLHFVPENAAIYQYAPVFWVESLATVSFGISWFVKGEAILQDD